MDDRIRVVVVDDREHPRDELTRLVERYGRIEVIGHARDADEAMAAARALLPDVMLFDADAQEEWTEVARRAAAATDEAVAVIVCPVGSLEPSELYATIVDAAGGEP